MKLFHPFMPSRVKVEEVKIEIDDSESEVSKRRRPTLIAVRHELKDELGDEAGRAGSLTPNIDDDDDDDDDESDFEEDADHVSNAAIHGSDCSHSDCQTPVMESDFEDLGCSSCSSCSSFFRNLPGDASSSGPLPEPSAAPASLGPKPPSCITTTSSSGPSAEAASLGPKQPRCPPPPRFFPHLVQELVPHKPKPETLCLFSKFPGPPPPQVSGLRPKPPDCPPPPWRLRSANAEDVPPRTIPPPPRKPQGRWYDSNKAKRDAMTKKDRTQSRRQRREKAALRSAAAACALVDTDI